MYPRYNNSVSQNPNYYYNQDDGRQHNYPQNYYQHYAAGYYDFERNNYNWHNGSLYRSSTQQQAFNYNYPNEQYMRRPPDVYRQQATYMKPNYTNNCATNVARGNTHHTNNNKKIAGQANVQKGPIKKKPPVTQKKQKQTTISVKSNVKASIVSVNNKNKPETENKSVKKLKCSTQDPCKGKDANGHKIISMENNQDSKNQSVTSCGKNDEIDDVIIIEPKVVIIDLTEAEENVASNDTESSNHIEEKGTLFTSTGTLTTTETNNETNKPDPNELHHSMTAKNEATAKDPDTTVNDDITLQPVGVINDLTEDGINVPSNRTRNSNLIKEKETYVTSKGNLTTTKTNIEVINSEPMVTTNEAIAENSTPDDHTAINVEIGETNTRVNVQKDIAVSTNTELIEENMNTTIRSTLSQVEVSAENKATEKTLPSFEKYSDEIRRSDADEETFIASVTETDTFSYESTTQNEEMLSKSKDDYPEHIGQEITYEMSTKGNFSEKNKNNLQQTKSVIGTRNTLLSKASQCSVQAKSKSYQYNRKISILRKRFEEFKKRINVFKHDAKLISSKKNVQQAKLKSQVLCKTGINQNNAQSKEQGTKINSTLPLITLLPESKNVDTEEVHNQTILTENETELNLELNAIHCDLNTNLQLSHGNITGNSCTIDLNTKEQQLAENQEHEVVSLSEKNDTGEVHIKSATETVMECNKPPDQNATNFYKNSCSILLSEKNLPQISKEIGHGDDLQYVDTNRNKIETELQNTNINLQSPESNLENNKEKINTHKEQTSVRTENETQLIKLQNDFICSNIKKITQRRTKSKLTEKKNQIKRNDNKIKLAASRNIKSTNEKMRCKLKYYSYSPGRSENNKRIGLEEGRQKLITTKRIIDSSKFDRNRYLNYRGNETSSRYGYKRPLSIETNDEICRKRFKDDMENTTNCSRSYRHDQRARNHSNDRVVGEIRTENKISRPPNRLGYFSDEETNYHTKYLKNRSNTAKRTNYQSDEDFNDHNKYWKNKLQTQKRREYHTEFRRNTEYYSDEDNDYYRNKFSSGQRIERRSHSHSRDTSEYFSDEDDHRRRHIRGFESKHYSTSPQRYRQCNEHNYQSRNSTRFERQYMNSPRRYRTYDTEKTYREKGTHDTPEKYYNSSPRHMSHHYDKDDNVRGKRSIIGATKSSQDSDSEFLRKAKQFVQDMNMKYDRMMNDNNSSKDSNQKIRNTKPKYRTNDFGDETRKSCAGKREIKGSTKMIVKRNSPTKVQSCVYKDSECKNVNKRLNDCDNDRIKDLETEIKRARISPIKFPDGKTKQFEEINDLRCLLNAPADDDYDLRNKLSSRGLDKVFTKLRNKQNSSETLKIQDQSNLIITIENEKENEHSEKNNTTTDINDDSNSNKTSFIENSKVSNTEKPSEKSEKLLKKLTYKKKHKNIKLVIKVICDSSSTSDEERNSSAEDVDFLDDLNVDEIINCINDVSKDKNKTNKDISPRIINVRRSDGTYFKTEIHSYDNSPVNNSDQNNKNNNNEDQRSQQPDSEVNAIQPQNKTPTLDFEIKTEPNSDNAAEKACESSQHEENINLTSINQEYLGKNTEPESRETLVEAVATSIESEPQDLEINNEVGNYEYANKAHLCSEIRENISNEKIVKIRGYLHEDDAEIQIKEEPSECENSQEMLSKVIDLTTNDKISEHNVKENETESRFTSVTNVNVEITDIKEELTENHESLEKICAMISNTSTIETNNNNKTRNSNGNLNCLHPDEPTDNNLEINDIKEELTERNEESLENICAMLYGAGNENFIRNINSIIHNSNQRPSQDYVKGAESERNSETNVTNETIQIPDFQTTLILNQSQDNISNEINKKQNNRNKHDLNRTLIKTKTEAAINNVQVTTNMNAPHLNNVSKKDTVETQSAESSIPNTINNKNQSQQVKNTKARKQSKTPIKGKTIPKAKFKFEINSKNVMTKNKNIMMEDETPDSLKGDKNIIIMLKELIHINLKASCKVEGLIHKGSFSNIYRCKDSKGMLYTAKITSESCNSYKNGIWLQRGLPQLNSNCVPLLNGFALSNHWCFIMEYYPKNLQQVIAKKMVPFHINLVQTLSKQLVDAVLFLKNNDIVHSDIKPSHILINSTNDQLKLAGFDEAYNVNYPSDYLNIGTLNYRAPEIIMGYSAGFSIDVWSTALVIYEMATRENLFTGKYDNHLLYQQICMLGNLPPEMIDASAYKDIHFAKRTFLKKTRNGTILVHNFNNCGRLYSNLMQVGKGRKNGKPLYAEQLNKLELLHEMLEKMLQIDPNKRLDIDAVSNCAFFT